MRARRDHHAGAGHRGRTSARWRGAGVVAAAALSLAAGAVPAPAAGGYTVTATIPVGSAPFGVAVDPAAGTVYVANLYGGTVSVIDEATRAVTATIPVGNSPQGVAVDPATHTVYVANSGGYLGVGTVSVIDAATRAVTATIPVGTQPLEVAVDPSTHTIYVTNFGDGTVSVISASLPGPVTTVTSSRNPSAFGRDVTFTASVGPADGGAITFSSESKTLCSAVPLTQVSGSNYQATCTTRALPVGSDTITAAYPGDASYAPSAGTLTQTVTRARTALRARLGLSRSQSFTLTATLTASGRPLSGQPVSFSTGHTHLCTPHTSTRGVATCVLTGPPVLAALDHHLFRARYPGNTSYQPSSAITVLPGW